MRNSNVAEPTGVETPADETAYFDPEYTAAEEDFDGEEAAPSEYTTESPEAAGVAGVPVGLLVLELGPAQRDLVRVDHDDEVTGVDVRSENGLVLAPQQHRHMAGQAAEHDVGGVDDMPLTRDVTVLRAESAHSRLAFACGS